MGWPGIFGLTKGHIAPHEQRVCRVNALAGVVADWNLDNATSSAKKLDQHFDRIQNMMFIRSANRFLENLAKYRAGEAVGPVFDPKLGY